MHLYGKFNPSLSEWITLHLIRDAIVLKKLDWAFRSQPFILKWPLPIMSFQTRVTFDHSPPPSPES
ncbi:hypothetical protein SADUNF_Sadunf16G0082800 [Salix dunnii]|uniref:Uncharacterized protein n=1 Tax=Salix dunnii TaxID=1413687 RepID=A0A835MGD1_9ROSI|nr:hypothetical protein SADUNF_Sadunf16G0082800 [Salix dunnii]